MNLHPMPSISINFIKKMGEKYIQKGGLGQKLSKQERKRKR